MTNSRLCKKLRRAAREALGHARSETMLTPHSGLHMFGWKTDPRSMARIPDFRMIEWATVTRTGFRALYQDLKKAANRLARRGVRRQEDRILHPRLTPKQDEASAT